LSGLHPLSKLLASLALVAIFIRLPAPYDSSMAMAVFLLATLVGRGSAAPLARILLRLFLTAMLWLLAMHTLRFSPPYFLFRELGSLLPYAGRFALALGLVASWNRVFTKDEIYAVLVNWAVPSPIVFLILRSVFLVPQIQRRAVDVLVAYHARGERLESLSDRARALLRSVPTLIASVFSESVDASIALSTKGIFNPGPRTTMARLVIGRADVAAASLSLAGVAAILYITAE
jgi:energy-coupling factor transporter transmembrane protein EcfT